MEENVFDRGSPLKIYLLQAMPVVLSMAISLVYNIADTYFISAPQDVNMVAGVSLCAPVFTVLMAFGNIFGQGGSSLIARLFGSKELDKTRAVSSFCFYAAILTGVVLGAVMLLFRTPLLKLMGADADTMPHASAYFCTLAAGAPFLVASFIHMNFLRSEGMAKESMFGSVGGLVLNVILDPIFISGLGLGAFGAALASVLGYLFSDVFLLVIVLKKSRILSPALRECRVTGEQLGQIFGVGISAAVTNWMTSICLVITNRFLYVYGTAKISAMGIAQKVSSIALLIMIGMVFGGAPMVGYFYGGKKYRRLKEMLRMILLLVSGVTLVIGAVLFAAARPITGLFLKDEEVITAGALMLRFQVVTMVFAGIVTLATVCFQASGKAVEAMVASVSRQGIIFLPIILIAAKTAGYYGILASQAIADVISAVLIGLLFYFRFYRALKEPETGE